MLWLDACHSGAKIEMRQSKYLDSLNEQDHRVVRRITCPMLRLKNFRCARERLGRIKNAHDPERPAQRDQR